MADRFLQTTALLPPHSPAGDPLSASSERSWTMKTPLILLFSVIASLAASDDGGLAQTNLNPAVREELNNLSSDLQQCFVYNYVGAQCFADKEPALNARIKAIADQQNSVSIMVGRIAGISDKAFLARTEMFMKEMKDDMDGDCINISVILNKYAKQCKTLMEGLEGRINTILSKGN
jgi:hypothetical protein